MFRRRNNKASTENADDTRVGGAMDPLPLPLGDTADSGMWYKKPGNSSKGNRNASNRSVSSHDEPLMRGREQQALSAGYHAGPIPYHEPHWSGRDDKHHRELSPSIPPPPSIQNTAPSPRADFPHHKQHQQHQKHQHTAGKLAKASQPPKHPPNPVFGTPGRPNVKTTGLIAILSKNDWSLACKRLDDDLKCARSKESVTLQGQVTVATPLHVAVCVGAPTLVIEKLLHVSPGAAKLTDDNCGRVPLHWACISGAPPHVLQLLLSAYPKSPKVMDRANGRLPLHYMVQNATSMEQVNVILDAERRAATHKDDRKKTPQDLVNESSNPLKRQILDELRKAAAKLASGKKKERQHNQDKHPQQDAVLHIHEWDKRHLEAMGDAAEASRHADQSSFLNTKASADTQPKHLINDIQQSSGTIGDEDRYRGRGRATHEFSNSSSQGHHRAPSPSPTARSAPEMWPMAELKPAPTAKSTPEKWPQEELKSADQNFQLNQAKPPSHHQILQQESKQSPSPLREAVPKHLASGGLVLDKSIIENARPASRGPGDSTGNHEDGLKGRSNQKKPPPNSSPNPHSYGHRPQRSPREIPLDTHELGAGSQGVTIAAFELDHYASAQTDFSANPSAGSESSRQSMGEYRAIDNLGYKDVQTPSAVVGQLLLDDMNSDIKSVEEKLARRRRILKEKINEVAVLDAKLSNMRDKEESLQRQMDSSQASLEKQQDILNEKRFRVSELSSQIAHLQSELQRERSEIEHMHESLTTQEESAHRVIEELQGTREERISLGAVREAMIDAKASLDREVSNCESELKSLQAIQQIAARGDNL